MELHQLRYFLAVVKTGNFSRAAERCHVSQPSLSQQILKLEDELGERLLERQRAKTVTTTAGELFRQRAERILQEVKEAEQEVQDLRGALRGKVDIGALPTIAPYLLPRIIEGFTALHSQVEIVVHEDTTARLVQSLEQNELELALTSLPLPGTKLETSFLFSEELLLALPAKHPLTGKRTIRFSDLAQQRFILMKEGHCLGTQSVQFCQTKGFSPQVVCRSGQIETIQALVRCGIGVSLVPQMACSILSGKDLVYRSVSRPPPMRPIVLAWNKQRRLSRTAKELQNFTRSLVG